MRRRGEFAVLAVEDANIGEDRDGSGRGYRFLRFLGEGDPRGDEGEREGRAEYVSQLFVHGHILAQATIGQKMANGTFSMRECKAIKKKWFRQFTLDYLFAEEED